MSDNNNKQLGCCGYDETSYKPPTTSPMGRAKIRAAVLDFTGKRRSLPAMQVGAQGSNPSYPIQNVGSTSRIWL